MHLVESVSLCLNVCEITAIPELTHTETFKLEELKKEKRYGGTREFHHNTFSCVVGQVYTVWKHLKSCMGVCVWVCGECGEG